MNTIRTVGMFGIMCGVIDTAIMSWLEISEQGEIDVFVWGLGLYTLLIAGVWYLGECLFGRGETASRMTISQSSKGRKRQPRYDR
jgi:hypothetical protein